MRFAFRCASVLSLFTLFTAPAHAAPFAFDESSDGELLLFPLTAFPFDAGVNTVVGQINNDNFNTPDNDSFSFTVPVGQQITAIELEMADLTGNPLSAGWNLATGMILDPDALLIGLIGSTSPGTGTYIGLLPQPAGTYTMINDILLIPGSPGNNVAIFAFSITLSPVPEPTSLGLIALGSLALVRRRR